MEGIIMIYRVDTIEDFLAIKDKLEPVYIMSKKYGKVPLFRARMLSWSGRN